MTNDENLAYWRTQRGFVNTSGIAAQHSSKTIHFNFRVWLYLLLCMARNVGLKSNKTFAVSSQEMTPINPCELKPERLLIILTPVAEMSGWSYSNLFCWHKSHPLSFLVSTQLVMKKGLLGNKAAITKAFYLMRTSLKDNNSNSQFNFVQGLGDCEIMCLT